MELLIFGGLLISVLSMLIAFSRRYSPDDSLQEAYVIKGLVFAFFAVGTFSVGRGLLDVVFGNSLDTVYLTLGGWIFAVPLILAFIFGLSHRRELQRVPLCFRNDGVIVRAKTSGNKGTVDIFGRVIRPRTKL